MKYDKMNRRMFLQGAGKAALAIPFLPSLVPSVAKGATGDQYFIFMPFNQGVPRIDMWPRNTTVPFTQTAANTKIRNLMDIIARDGNISTLFGTDWNTYAPKLNIITHLNMYSTTSDHSNTTPGCAHSDRRPLSDEEGGFLGGSNPIYERLASPMYSIDYAIREAWKAKGYAAIHPHLLINLGYYDEQYEYDVFSFGDTYSGKVGQACKGMLDNVQKLEQLVYGKQQGTSDPRKKLVDGVLEDYKRVRNDRRTSSLDIQRLDHAMEQWNEIQNRAQSMGVCTLPASLGSETNYRLQNQQIVDIMTMALSCGLTRVVTQAMIQGADTFPGDNEIHTWSHGDVYANFQKGFQWKFQFFKRYADRLAALKDPNGMPLLDSSLLFLATEYADAGAHLQLGKTVLTLGGAGGKMKTGLHIHAGGAPFQRAHITVMKAMGLSQAQIELSGAPGFGEYVAGNSEEWDEALQKATGNNAEYLFKKSDLSKFATDAEKRAAFAGVLV